MKIAIKGHPTRGHEIIQILESLGGKNDCPLTGTDKDFYYYIHNDFHKRICCHYTDYVDKCKKYTLEEFEKEYPFKIGDKVIYSNTPNLIGTVVDIKFDNIIPYQINIKGATCTCGTNMLKPYKEMKEERNITLTLEKAQEWYKKGGELKEIALQAFTEKELNPLPKSWEEYCKRYPIKKDESYINSEGKIISFTTKTARRDWNHICPSKKSAEAHLALIQLEQLRDCWRGDWKPTSKKAVYAIKVYGEKLGAFYYCTREFLSFQTRKMAEEFLECFKDLIEKARDLI